MVAEGAIEVEFIVGGYTYFQLVFSPGIGDDLKIVDTASETSIANNGPENIGGLLQKHVCVSLGDFNACSILLSIPAKTLSCDYLFAGAVGDKNSGYAWRHELF